MADTTAARPEQSPTKYFDFTSNFAHDLFRADSILAAARLMLCKELDVDAGDGMHIDNLLLEVSEKLNVLAKRIDATCCEYQQVKP